MRRAWIVGCVLLLAACSRKVTDSAVDLSVEYKGYVPQCVRVTAADAQAPQEHTSSETLSRDKLASTAPNDDRTVRIAVYREESWSQKLLIEVTSFTDKCDGTVAETRKLEPVTLPARGAEPRTLKLLAADGDNDGFFAKLDDGAIPLATDCNDQNRGVFPGAAAVCDGAGSLGVDFNCDGRSDCNGSMCTSDAQCGSGFCVDGVCCNDACNSPPTCRGTGVCNAAGSVGACTYPVTPNVNCSDGNGCTVNDKCDSSGTCAGTARECKTAPSQCYSNSGTCNVATGGCEYPPQSNTTSCNDGKACTSPDKCDGQGACVSTMSCTPPSECKVASTTACYETGTCVFEVNTAQVGKTCTEANKKGTCSPEGACLRFLYAVTPNFDPELIAQNRTLNDMTVSCAATLDTSGTTPTWTDTGCGFPKPTPVVLGSVVVVPVRNLVVDAPLRLVGTRPVILAVYGNATLNDEIRANSVHTQTQMGAGSGAGCTERVGAAGSENSGDGSGGGGGGLATSGGTGGANDDNSRAGGAGGATLTSGFSTLGASGGCAGGDGGAASDVTAGKGGAGGGSVQLSVAGMLTVRSVVSVSGAAGRGGGAVDGKRAGGGGGGSGGLLVLEADALILESTAKLTANGGAGGEGGALAGGTLAPGNNGTDASVTGSSPASGGTGSSNAGGDGGAGAAGTAGPGHGSRGSNTGNNNEGSGGGGGGAAGRILLRGVTSCPGIPTDSVVSPAPTTGGMCP